MREPIRLEPEDLMEIDAQESQKLFLGQEATPEWEDAEALAEQPAAWCVRRDDGSILACFGINEIVPGFQGVAWALLSEPIGSDHLALTRFVRKVVDECGLQRLELLAKCRDVEPTRDFFISHAAPVDSTSLVRAMMGDPTPECRWALALGFEAAHVLRKVGAASETYMLFERIA